jgi:type IV pilus assembly protein PilB
MIRDALLINACVQQGLFDNELVVDVKKEAQRKKQSLLIALAYASRLPVSAFYRAYASLHHIPFVSGSALNVDLNVLRKLPVGMAERKLLMPINMEPEDVTQPSVQTNRTRLYLVVANPEDKAGIQQFERATGATVVLFMGDPVAIAYALKKAYAKLPVLSALSGNESKFDSIEMLDDLFGEAWLSRASDIHIEAHKESVQVRLRVDGRLQEYPRQFSVEEGLSLMSRMKVLAALDISEQRMPQDGALTHTLVNGVEFDVRCATMPTRFGERATLRLLGSDSQALSLAGIGMSAIDLQRFEREIQKPHGMILITGPTGSGKSTTLYAALQQVSSPEINIMTVEDPIEYVMSGVAQVQVGSKVSFSSALRSFLRHDPDVMMVGEIRDGETAGIGMKAAMTGHLVFSTLHTNSAAGAVNRLVDMGAERYLIGATLLAVIAQRLVRRLCAECRQERVVTVREAEFFGFDIEQKVYEPKGCAHCLDSGYKGRLALFETYWIDTKARQLINDGATEAELIRHAKDFSDLLHDGVSKVSNGLTSLAELKRLGLLNNYEVHAS